MSDTNAIPNCPGCLKPLTLVKREYWDGSDVLRCGCGLKADRRDTPEERQRLRNIEPWYNVSLIKIGSAIPGWADVQGKINRFRRIQAVTMAQLFPQHDKSKCACGCGVKLTGRKKRWASKRCSVVAHASYLFLDGNSDTLRTYVWMRDKGKCAGCGTVVKRNDGDHWQADHIKEVRHGGGACGMDNLQTLCTVCHKEKTKKNY